MNAGRWRCPRQGSGHERRASCVGLYRDTRSPIDAAGEPLARAEMDPVVDDFSDAMRRRMVVVRAGNYFAGLWRAGAICGGGFGDVGSGDRDSGLQSDEEDEPEEAAESAGAALLVESSAAGPVFISFGAHHYSFRHRDDGGSVLSAITELFDHVRGEYRDQQNTSGDALPE